MVHNNHNNNNFKIIILIMFILHNKNKFKIIILTMFILFYYFEPIKGGMHPCVANNFFTDGFVRCNNPFCNDIACWGFNYISIFCLGNNPFMPLTSNSVLKGLVESHINWLTMRSSSTRDVLYFYTKFLNLCHYVLQHVTVIRIKVQDWSYV